MLKSAWWAAVDDVEMAVSPMSPTALVKALRQETPEDAILVVDAGNRWGLVASLARAAPRAVPEARRLREHGLCAARRRRGEVLEPERPVVALVGDGALGMTMGELETVVRERLSICIVIMNDIGYGNIRQEELAHYGDRLIGVDFVDADYAAIALGFGIASHRAESGDELHVRR